MTYGYCRISLKSQSIERQIRNILEIEPKVKIYQEAFTGAKIEGRKELEKLLKQIEKGDTLIFDSVSRMSRNAEEGVTLYFELLEKGVELRFLKEPYINTAVYRKATEKQLEATGHKIADLYISATNEALKILAKEQIEIAFNQAEKEVKDLRERTKEGLRTAKINGKTLGKPMGLKIETQKSIKAKQIIKKYYNKFGGTLGADDTIKMTLDENKKVINKKSFFKYVKELKEIKVKELTT